MQVMDNLKLPKDLQDIQVSPLDIDSYNFFSSNCHERTARSRAGERNNSLFGYEQHAVNDSMGTHGLHNEQFSSQDQSDFNSPLNQVSYRVNGFQSGLSENSFDLCQTPFMNSILDEVSTILPELNFLSPEPNFLTPETNNPYNDDSTLTYAAVNQVIINNA